MAGSRLCCAPTARLLRRGRISKLRRAPHGIVLDEFPATDVLREKVRHPDGRVRLDSPPILDELRRLATVNGDSGEFPLRLIGMRELRSHNSWMHNAPLLMRGGRTHAARIHPDDAEDRGITDGEPVRVVSAPGAIELPALVSDEIARHLRRHRHA